MTRIFACVKLQIKFIFNSYDSEVIHPAFATKSNRLWHQCKWYSAHPPNITNSKDDYKQGKNRREIKLVKKSVINIFAIELALELSP